MLGKFTNYTGETFNQVCLTAQKLHPIDITRYTKFDVIVLDNGLIVVSLRRIMQEEIVKIIPVL